MKKNSRRLTLEEIGNFLDKLAEKSENVYWLSSPDFKKIQYISPAYEKIWGRPREILYLNPELWITYLHPDDVINYHPIQAMAEKITSLGQNARYEENYRIVRPDGEIRWILDRGFPVYDENGVCCGVTGTAVDISREKKAEEDLRSAKEGAEQANKAKTEFLSDVIKNITKPFEQLKHTLKNEHKKFGINEIKIFIEIMNQTLYDIKSFSKFNLTQKNQFSDNETTHNITGSPEKLKTFRVFYHKHNLTARESECVYHMVCGMSAKQIARTIGLSNRTVEFYLNNAKLKLNCKTKQELIFKVFKDGRA